MNQAARTHAPTPTHTHAPELRAAARRITEGWAERTASYLPRRRLVGGAAAALAFGIGLPGSAHAAEADAKRLAANPFTLGVASGDPKPDSVLLWTRLAPRPLEPGGGLPKGKITLQWEIAHDARFGRIVQRGKVIAHPEVHHSVHLEVKGLDNDRVYHYRFRTGDWISPAGRTRTAPARTARITEVKLAAVSCQAYHEGYFTAYRHLADEDLDLVVHLGDYLYEYGVNAAGGARKYTDRTLPAHFNRETRTLGEYRLRYGLYRSDPDLQAAHAAHPFVLTWDDHETENNYAAGRAEAEGVPPEEFLLRRAAAYRAYWENQPLRLPQRPKGPDMRLYRRLHFGRLAQFDVLDTRQYRSDQLYGDGWHPPGPELDDPARTMTGAAQERWLLDGWQDSGATWNLLAQQVTFARRRDVPGAGHRVDMDSWDGCPAARRRLLDGARTAGIGNLMILTGDVHAAYGFDLKADWDDPRSRTLGTEIATTSVSSGGNGSDRPGNHEDLTRANPHLRFFNGRRGYTTVTLSERRARADFRTVAAVTVPDAPITTAASFVTEAGDPGLTPV
ncbi:alkaline phosphatase D family protein [Streptomyces amakusaensis]|uniref:Alkaline phosphatase D family protein n=1 Tax=Streptomyces amakusaensis TaxID=67271 RepID=A0ABW0AMM5_9ACTN